MQSRAHDWTPGAAAAGAPAARDVRPAAARGAGGGAAPGPGGPAPWCTIVEHPDGYVVQFGGGAGEAAALGERLRSLRGSVPAARRRWDPAGRAWWIDPVVEVMFRSVTRWAARSFPAPRVHWESRPDLAAYRWAALSSGETVDDGWVTTVETKPPPVVRPRVHVRTPPAPHPTPPAAGAPAAGPHASAPAARALPAPTDPHAVLWLRPGAPWPVIKAAYRSLAAIHHPDRGGDESTMRELNAAYAVLRRRSEEDCPAAPLATVSDEGGDKDEDEDEDAGDGW